MRVAETPDFLQSVIDHPKVRPWIGQDSEQGNVQLSQIFGEGIGLEFETGGFFFHSLGDGVYEVHTLFLPGTTTALESCLAAAHFMFCGTDCMRIVTKVPEDNVPAWKLTEKMGFRKDYTREKAYTRGGVLHDVRHYSLGMEAWGRNRLPGWVKGQCDALGNASKGDRYLKRWAVYNDDYSVLETLPCPQQAQSLEP